MTDQNAQNGAPELERVCRECRSAFADDSRTCPNCDAARPDDGWTRLRDYPDAWLGRTVGDRYRLLQRMGEGTFGAVYRAERPHLDDTYAVKIIKLEGADVDDQSPSLRERVEREVQILSTISSPHIVNVHDYVELVGGAVGVIMDFVRGRTLREILDQDGALALDRTTQFGIEIATGLREVHSRGVVHRDLKPDNVMVQSMGRRGEFVELIDFGVARFETDVRRTVGFIGTPRYTSPEQARGDDSDKRSDVYNLGMLLYHMLAGRPPFTSDDVNELLEAHSRETPPLLDEVASDRTIPAALESLIRMMMSKNPEDRPQHMQAVLRALKPIRRDLREGERAPTDAQSGREQHDSLPPSFQTDVNRSAGSSHQTSEQEPLIRDDFQDRPPSDTYSVADERRIVYCDENNTLRIRIPDGDATNETELVTLEEPVTSIACESHDWVIVGQEGGKVSSYSVESRELETVLTKPALGPVTSVATNANADLVVVGFASGAVLHGGPDDSAAKWDELRSGAPVVSVAVHQDGGCVAVAREDASTEVFIPDRSSKEPTTVVEQSDVPESVDFSPDGYLVAVGFDDGMVQLFSALTGAYVSESPQSALRASSVFEEDSSPDL